MGGYKNTIHDTAKHKGVETMGTQVPIKGGGWEKNSPHSDAVLRKSQNFLYITCQKETRGPVRVGAHMGPYRLGRVLVTIWILCISQDLESKLQSLLHMGALHPFNQFGIRNKSRQ